MKKEEEEPEIDLSQFRKSEAAPVVKRTQPTSAPEAAPEKEEAPASAAKEEAALAPEAPKAEAPAEADSAAQDGPKVVGKVDLDALKPKKPAKKVAKKRKSSLLPLKPPSRLTQSLLRKPSRKLKKRCSPPSLKWCERKREAVGPDGGG